MLESHDEYWARRAEEHAKLAKEAAHGDAMAAHRALARAYRERAQDGKSAANG